MSPPRVDIISEETKKAALTPLPVTPQAGGHGAVNTTTASKQQCPTESPIAVGTRFGGTSSQLEVGLFIDLCCPRSKDMFTTVFKQVQPRLDAQYPQKQVAFVVHHWSRPWNGCGSLAVNEVAVAVRHVSRDMYLNFCLAVFDAQESFRPGALYDLSRKAIHERAIDIAAGLGVDRTALTDLLAVDATGVNKITASMRTSTLFAIQNGIRASPTVTVNGLVDFMVFPSWGLAKWCSYLSPLLV